MILIEIDEDLKEAKLNKVWLYTIPEFKKLITRDKGSPGDSKGEKKRYAIQEFTYIYYIASFASPLRDWEPAEKKREALHYASLDEKALDKEVLAAIAKYEELQLKSSRPLRSLKAVYKGLDALDKYYEDMDFSLTDKMGKLKNDPSGFTVNIKRLDEAYTAVRNLERRVEEDLKAGTTGIRGSNTLGNNEGRVREWSEDDIRRNSDSAADGTVELSNKEHTYDHLMKEIQEHTVKEFDKKELKREMEEEDK